MEWPPAFYLRVVMFAFQLWVDGSFGCFYEEESALLELKSSINHPNGTYLPSWRVGTDCCTWKRVTCSSTVGRVIALDLSSTIEYRFIWPNYWYLNASLLLPFEELQSLDLSDNLLRGFIDEEAIENLTSLRNIGFAWNGFNDSQSIQGFCKLKGLQRLDLSYNYFEGPLPIKAIETLTSLRTVDFSFNRFNDSQSIQGFCKLKDLQRLDLSYNYFKGPIPLCLGSLTSLQLLNLSNNGFSGMLPTSTTRNDESQGPLPIKGLCKFKDIKWLDLSFNDFDGSIPSCLSNFSNLQLLDLSNNGFGGKIPASTFSNATSLSYLSLAKNNFSGTVEFKSFAHLSKLKEFVLSYNDLEVETEYPMLNSTFQLTVLGLSNCKLNKDTGGGTDSYFTPPLNVYALDIIISEATDGLKEVGFITKRMENYYKGGILNYMSGIDVSCNQLTGEIPREMGQLSGLHSMNLSYNQFAGPIPATFRNLRQIESLDLSHNKLNGTIPLELTELNYLAVFSVAHNNLSGRILDMKSQFSTFTESSYEGNPLLCGPPLSKSCISTAPISKAPEEDENEDDDNIVSFYCSFAGSYLVFIIGTIGVLYFISQRGAMCFLYVVDSWCAFRLYELYELFGCLLMLCSFAHLSKIKTIVLSNNDLEVETEYPPWNSSFQLERLFLSNCKLNRRTGVIPHFLHGQHDLTEVDLSHNHLSGRFPVWLLESNTRLEMLDLRNNSFFGTFQLLPNSNNTTLFSLDISNNNFSGQIPFDIGTLLPKLGWLNLSINSFQGSLPSSMGNMTEFVTLDLSHNNLSGEVPEHMVAGWGDMQFLRLSNNNFDGRLSSAYFNMTSLGSLYLDHNNFVGTIPPIISNDSSLNVLDIEDNNMWGRLSKQIGDLSGLSTLILRGNHFDGTVSTELCKLSELSLLDLSDNKLSGPIPSCSNLTNLMYIHLEMNAFSGLIPSALSRSSSIKLVNIRDNYIGGVLPTWVGGLSQLRILLLKGNNLHGHIPIELCQPQKSKSVVLDGAYVIDDRSARYLTPGEIIVAEFMTKSIKYSYKGDILNYMSGIDLSCNHLTGEIPVEMGQLNGLLSLNLSHNQFTGPIPITFKNLSLIESLDLSYNRLNGTIPSELTELTYLEIFSVAHNNLSGRTPDMKSQFATLSGSSYEGNALLCGAPLSKRCISTTPTIPAAEEEEEKDDNEDNRVSFYSSFVGSYFVFLLGTVVVLYFTSERRAMCFFHVVDSWCVFYLYKARNLFHCK
ncbi:hypothetical protein AAC387_Pa03g0483 [Persea americana]